MPCPLPAYCRSAAAYGLPGRRHQRFSPGANRWCRRGRHQGHEASEDRMRCRRTGSGPGGVGRFLRRPPSLPPPLLPGTPHDRAARRDASHVPPSAPATPLTVWDKAARPRWKSGSESCESLDYRQIGGKLSNTPEHRKEPHRWRRRPSALVTPSRLWPGPRECTYRRRSHQRRLMTQSTDTEHRGPPYAA
jgi:hypothetical protein